MAKFCVKPRTAAPADFNYLLTNVSGGLIL
jgi:hypothetical protein